MSTRANRLLQLALKGRIITPVSPAEIVTASWTEFTDKWAGGCAKEPWDHILIQALPSTACCVFEAVFEHHPRNISCGCCGEEYFVTQAADIDVQNSLFIKSADILSEWIKPAPMEFYKGATPFSAFTATSSGPSFTATSVAAGMFPHLKTKL